MISFGVLSLWEGAFLSYKCQNIQEIAVLSNIFLEKFIYFKKNNVSLQSDTAEVCRALADCKCSQKHIHHHLSPISHLSIIKIANK